MSHWDIGVTHLKKGLPAKALNKIKASMAVPEEAAAKVYADHFDIPTTLASWQISSTASLHALPVVGPSSPQSPRFAETFGGVAGDVATDQRDVCSEVGFVMSGNPQAHDGQLVACR